MGPADPEAFGRVQAQAEAELGAEAPELVGADEERSEERPSADEPGPSEAEDGPPDVGDVELVVRTMGLGVAWLVGLKWQDHGARVRRAVPRGAERFAEHFGPRLRNRGLWASLAVLASFVDLDPPAREREITVGR